MKHLLIIFILATLTHRLSAQKFVYSLIADSVKVTNCDSAELIIENHTQGVPGFLYNTGNGRTKFKRGAQKINDSLYVVGSDTINLKTSWLQGGNTFGTTGVLGTLDTNHLDFYTNKIQRTRLTNSGRLLIGTTTDNGYNNLQVNGSVYSNYFTNSLTALGGIKGPSGGIRLRMGTPDGTYISYYFEGRNSRRTNFSSVSDSRPFIIEDSVGVSFKNTPYVSVGDEFGVGNGGKLTVINPNGSPVDAFGVGRFNVDGSISNDLQVKRSGNVVIGGLTDNLTHKVQIGGNNGAIYIDTRLSLTGDRIRIGGNLNLGDGQESIIAASSDSGVSYRNILVWRNGITGLGTLPSGTGGYYVGNPGLVITAKGNVLCRTSVYMGNEGGPINSSALVSTVSNTNEWLDGNNYPNGQNNYFFGTILQMPTIGYKRAPLQIGADQLQFMTGGNSNVEAGRFSEAGNLLLGSITDNSNKLQVTGTSYFSGNVGLGTSNPATQLHTTGTVRFAGLASDTNQTRIIVSDASGNLYYRSMSSLHASNGILSSSMAENGVINSSLAVNGTLSAKKLTLSQSGWPDYVFAPDYRLPSLQDLERYIKQHNHLPDVPSAAEVQEKGLDVGNNQAALLKKVEELTLYMISQEKVIQKQNKEIAELKERDEKIERQATELDILRQEMMELKKMLQNKPGK